LREDKTFHERDHYFRAVVEENVLTKSTTSSRKRTFEHPRPPLALLVTYCHFAAIYGRSPIGLPVPAPLKDIPEAEALNRLLQQLAWEAVTAHPLSGVRSTPRIQ
jgi:hypothetical protein